MSTNLADVQLDDLISQAEAARLRGVSRQAIAKLVYRGKLRPFLVAGKILVSRTEVLRFEATPAGRPRKASDDAKRSD